MAAITCERFFFEKTSAIASGAHSIKGIPILKVQSLKFVCFAVEILVVHVPAEGKPEFVNEVAVVITLIRPAATFSHPMGEGKFLIGRGTVEFLVGPKIRHKLFNLCKGHVKLRHVAGSVKGFYPHAAGCIKPI